MIIKINNKLLLLLLQHFCSYLVVLNYLNEENQIIIYLLHYFYYKFIIKYFNHLNK